jgi:hypothetical protein
MRRSALAFATFLLLPTGAFAQMETEFPGPEAGDWELTLSGNGTSNNDFDGHVLGASGSIGKYIHENVLLGARQSVNFADVENGDDVINAATRGFADYVFNLGRLRPYVGVSAGGIYGEQVNDTFAAGPEVGLKYYADNNTFVFAQSEYQITFTDADEAGEAADDGQFFHTIGIGFNF